MIITAQNYAIMVNYTFALMEGVYLHNLIFLNLFTNNGEISTYILLGWGLPIVFLVPWVVVKSEFDDTLCWITYNNNYYHLILIVPMTVTIYTNFGIFIRIIRVLRGKINSMYTQQLNTKYRKLARSTIILIHLLGVPYTISLVTYYTRNLYTTFEFIWIFCDQTFTAFLGFIVSIIFFLLNREVRLEVQRKYASIRGNSKGRVKNRNVTQQFMFTVQEVDKKDKIVEEGGLANQADEKGGAVYVTTRF